MTPVQTPVHEDADLRERIAEALNKAMGRVSFYGGHWSPGYGCKLAVDALTAPGGPLADIIARDAALTAERDAAAARATRLNAEQHALVREISALAARVGYAEGALAMSERAGIVEGWRERALRAEAELDAVDRAFEGLDETDRARRIGEWIATAASERTACQDAESRAAALADEVKRLKAENAGLRERLDNGFEARARRALGDPSKGVTLTCTGAREIGPAPTSTALATTGHTDPGERSGGGHGE